MLDKMIAYCGLDCVECLAYIATQCDDDEKRTEVAEEWNNLHGFNLKPDDINCDGCLQTNGKLLNYCSICEVRKCCIQKEVINCAYCDEYACEKLSAMSWYDTKAKPVLDEIRENR